MLHVFSDYSVAEAVKKFEMFGLRPGPSTHLPRDKCNRYVMEGLLLCFTALIVCREGGSGAKQLELFNYLKN